MTQRKLEITEPGGFMHGRDRYVQGEVRFVEEPMATEFVRLGWAKDADTGEQGTRTPGAQSLHVDDQYVTTNAGAV